MPIEPGEIAPVSHTNGDGGDYSPGELEFMMAIERYKRRNGRPWPSWSEVFAILQSLGYRKVAEHEPLPKFFVRVKHPAARYH